MPHVDSAFAVSAADVRLPPADAWATEVLQSCARAHYTPQQELLHVLAPLPAASAATEDEHQGNPLKRGRNTTASRTTVESLSDAPPPPVIDVDAEEDVDATPCPASPDDPLSTNGGAYQPYLPRVVRAAPTAETQAFRAALSASLLRKAYRLPTPCMTTHSTKAERLLNCAAAPKCMSGLRTLAGDAVTREDCLTVAMGEGPHVIAIPATKPAETAGVAAAKGGRTSVGTKHPAAPLTTAAEVKDAITAEAAATTTLTTTARTVSDDPSFPCLWRGVKNLMNTCYFSSVLQLVFSVARLRRAILDDGAAEHPLGRNNGDSSSAIAAPTQLEESGLKELFALMAFSREGAGADPKSFAAYLSLDVKVQQDAQEFFTLLLDWLRCHCGPAVQAAVTNTFSGTLLYDRRCGACGRSAKRAEPFLYLSLPVRATLEDSLSEFSKPEEVDGFMCEGCGKTAVATSRQYMRTLPDVLVVHWNRFEFDLQTLQRHKVTTATSFPLQLDMAGYMRQWHEHKRSSANTHAGAHTTTATATAATSAKEEVEENYCYELRGIVNHHGDTAVSGHYTYHGKVSSAAVVSNSASGTAAAAATAPANTWLNFNDAEVTPLNRYQGQRGISADAYLLVYHRVAPPPAAPAAAAHVPSTHGAAATTRVTHSADRHAPSTTSTGTAASAAASSAPGAVVSTTVAPTPSELPPYLRQYVDQVNQRCLDERQAWLDQRAAVAELFDLWATTAQSVFDTPAPSAWTSTTAAAGASGAVGSAATLYALPTAWLQQLGRFFLPAYVDVAALGGGAESQLKRNRKDTAGDGSTASLDGSANNASSSSSSNIIGASGTTSGAGDNEERSGGASESAADGAPVEGVVVPPIGPRRHGYIQSVEDVYQLVRQHSLLQALPSLNCSHGYLAPWGPYKLVSAGAFAKLTHFLRVCGAPLQVATAGGAANTLSSPVASPQNAEPLDAQSSCAFVDANLCPLCVAAMAAAVRGLAIATAEDEYAELSLTQAWHDAEKRKEAEESQTAAATAGGGGLAGVSDAAHKDTTLSSTGHNGASGSSSHANADDESTGEVLVGETVVEGWASYYVNQLAWARVQQTEGYTGMVVMKEARLNPPRAPSSVTRASRGGATSPPSPTSPPSSTTANTSTISFTLSSGEDNSNGIAALNVDKGDLDLSAQLLCPHGALRPGQHVVTIPATLRKYWVRRFTELLTMAHRAGQLRTVDPAWRVTCEDISHFLLPYIPASTTSTTCLECMRNSVQTITSRHHQRLRKMEERRKFPSLWLAGAMTSPAGIAQLLLATGAENEEQLLAAQHPNRLFFKHSAEREYREYAKKWTEAQQARIAHQEAEVLRLSTALAKKKEHDAAWNARVTSRRGGGRSGGRGGSAKGPNGSPTRETEADASAADAAAPTALPDPETLEGRFYYAEQTLARLRTQPVPDYDVAYGCVPTWWVARWYAAMQDDHPRGQGSEQASATAVDDAVEEGGEDGAAGAKKTTSPTSTTAGGLPPIAYKEFKCEHGGCLLDVPWLNPSDGFWQGVRGKRAEVLWNGVRIERASTSASAPPGQELGPGKEEYRSQCWLPPLVILPMEEYLALLSQYGAPDMLEKTQHNNKTAAAAAGVTDVDAEEATPAPLSTASGVAAADGSSSISSSNNTKADASKTAPVAAADAEGDAATSAQSALSPVPGTVIQIVTHNGVRQLQPAPCAECCTQLLAKFEVNCESFVNGSLKLNFHIKKSRKNFYDASSVLTSATVQQSKAGDVSATSGTAAAAATADVAHGSHAGVPITVGDNEEGNEGSLNTAPPASNPLAGGGGKTPSHHPTASMPDGIHFYTTLAQLRTYITAHLREKHGYLVQPEDLQIMRGKNKPLKLRPLTPSPQGQPTLPAPQQQEVSAAQLEEATLQDLGIRDGDTLTVQSVDVIAQVCATAPGVDEEWEAIPPELLQGGGSGGPAGGGFGAAAAREHTAAFRETRLQGSHAPAGGLPTPNSHSGGGAGPHAATSAAESLAVTGAVVGAAAAPEEQGVACAVCTFLNAPGMVVCEMCEAPLPAR